MTKNVINIGLPSKGRLKHDTINIFKKKKLNIYSQRGERDLFGHIKKLPNVKIIYLHARECIEQLSLGNIDIGFSGYDLFKESEINVQNKILMVADYNLDFTKKIGAELDLNKRGLGMRSSRYTMLVEKGNVVKISEEEVAGKCERTAAENFLKEI